MLNKITNNLDQALFQLQAGELVAFPTETVYGLGADARNLCAVQKVFAAKGRPTDHPLIVHIADPAQLEAWALDIPDIAWQYAEKFWPGPLTLILRKQPWVSEIITGGQNTVALRIPKHPLTLELLQRFGSGLVGPSANKYGRVSPTTAQHVATDLYDIDVVILDGGACSVGIESTIVDLTTVQPILRRNGDISAEKLGIAAVEQVNMAGLSRTSGSHASHYAPRTPVKLVSSAELFNTVAQYQHQQTEFSVLSLQPRPENLPDRYFWQQVATDPVIYAHDLYANLRAHDRLHNAAILIETPPITWTAIIDRLKRASN